MSAAGSSAISGASRWLAARPVLNPVTVSTPINSSESVERRPPRISTSFCGYWLTILILVLRVAAAALSREPEDDPALLRSSHLVSTAVPDGSDFPVDDPATVPGRPHPAEPVGRCPRTVAGNRHPDHKPRDSVDVSRTSACPAASRRPHRSYPPDKP